MDMYSESTDVDEGVVRLEVSTALHGSTSARSPIHISLRFLGSDRGVSEPHLRDFTFDTIVSPAKCGVDIIF